jgi:hypothetical protein
LADARRALARSSPDDHVRVDLQALDRIFTRSHLERDPEFLVELPQRVQILDIRTSYGNTGSVDPSVTNRRTI